MSKETWSDTQKLLAFTLVISFVGVILVLLFFPPKADAALTAAILTLVGGLGAMAATVATFYFGSSKGSSNKDDTIKDVVASQAKAIEEKTNGQPHS